MKKIILASTSPRRKELLSQLGLEFKIVATDYKEDMVSELPPLELAKHLSRGKVESATKDHKDCLIIAADTFVVLEKKLLGKPRTEAGAIEMLREISGKAVSVITGFTVMDTSNDKIISKAVETKVFIKDLTENEIKNYVASKEPMDKAGAFAIQGLGAVIVEKIEGDYFNVIGLSLCTLSEVLKKFGVTVL